MSSDTRNAPSRVRLHEGGTGLPDGIDERDRRTPGAAAANAAAAA